MIKYIDELNVYYITEVTYAVKPNTNYETIKDVTYYYNYGYGFSKYTENVHSFAQTIYGKRNICFAGQYCKGIYGDYLDNYVEVIAYKQDDGEYWIKSSPNSTTADNLTTLEEYKYNKNLDAFRFLRYAKNYGFARKV